MSAEGGIQEHVVPPLPEQQLQPPAPLLKTVFSQRGGGDPNGSKGNEGSIEG